MKSIAALLVIAVACDGPASGPAVPKSPRPSAPLDAADDAAPAVDAASAPVVPALTAPPGSLDALFAALARAEQHAADGRVLISIFGDSHTAGDGLTSRLRGLLHARFGDAGRGIVAAGKPAAYRHYYQRDVDYGASGRWRTSVGGRNKSDDVEPFGVMGLRVAAKKAAEAWVATCADCASGGHVSRFDIYYWHGPDGGDLEYRVDGGAWQKTSTRGTPPRPEVVSVPVVDGAHRLSMRRGRKGTIALFGVALERDRPGVVVDGLGVVGRRLGHLHQWDWSVIGPQLARRDPRLVVLQYGTNEADDDELDLVRVATQYDEVIARLKSTVPGASILILGPPDSAMRAAGRACDRNRKPPPEAVDAAIAPECEWRTMPFLPAIVDMQRAAAARHGVAFYDSFAALGGADKMDAFVTSEPPLAHGDRVHFTSAGYALWADALYADLVAAYAKWSAATTGPRP